MTRRESHDVLERRTLELLPWYVNGTLEGDERELVRRQVLTSLTCRRELDRLRRLQELIRHDDAEAVATDRAFEHLMARIEASDMTPRGRPRGFGMQFSGMRLAVAAALVAAVSSLWWWADAPDIAPATYDTMSLPQPADLRTATVRVVFAPEITESQRHEILASHGLKAVSPPTADGVVTLSFAAGADQAAIVAALRQDSRILLVTTPPEAGAP